MLWQLLGQILREHLFTVLTPSSRHFVQDSDQIKQVLDYIRRNYASQLSLSDLAKYCSSLRNILPCVSLDHWQIAH